MASVVMLETMTLVYMFLPCMLHSFLLVLNWFCHVHHFLYEWVSQEVPLLLSLRRRCWLCDQTCSLFDTQSGRTG